MAYYPTFQPYPYQDQLNQLRTANPMPMQGFQMPMQQLRPDPTGLNWVQGEAGAKSFLVSPNATVVLWDTESPTIYIKSADATGKPLAMRILDFKERGGPQEEHKCTCGEKYVDKDTFRKLQEKCTELEGLVNKLEYEKEEPNA
jgi:hypothetical protein